MAKSLAQLGGGSGVKYVECHTEDGTTLQCELSPQQIIDLYNSGENIELKVIAEMSGATQEAYVPLLSALTVSGNTVLYFMYTTCDKIGNTFSITQSKVTVTKISMQLESITKSFSE